MMGMTSQSAIESSSMNKLSVTKKKEISLESICTYQNPRRDSCVCWYDTMFLLVWVILSMVFACYDKH